jgi:predicted secreted Zn-dependent protease
MWDLDDHERHHAELWIKAANRMIVAINSVPPGPSCSEVVAAAKARVAQVFRTYDRRQRAFDRDVAAGRLPGPSLP